ncbi:hypothetical protein GCM10022277_30400 [Litoribacillus peritrichatus]|uniref:Co-chaperonin GroES n=2 Tax=Litoribacillus peritrichatus TaxID=718191 RepID=A0ABP7MWG3_9GAMM
MSSSAKINNEKIVRNLNFFHFLPLKLFPESQDKELSKICADKQRISININVLSGRHLSMKIRPLGDRVVVRRKEEETKSAGGIVLPGSATEKPNQGEVLAVGNGRVLDNGDVRPVDLKVGDTVLFGGYVQNTVTVEGEELLVLSEAEIFGVVEA